MCRGGIVCPCGKPYICNNAKLHGASGTPPPTIYMSICNNGKGCRGDIVCPRGKPYICNNAKLHGASGTPPPTIYTSICNNGKRCRGSNARPQCVKKRQFCYVENVGANSVRPPTWRSNAFSGVVSLQGKRTRASNARPYSPRMVVRRGRRCGVA